MAVKYFCDVCHKEIKDQRDRLIRVLGRVMVEVMVRLDGCWNYGHVCHSCVTKVVNQGKEADKKEAYVFTAEKTA